MKHILCVLIIVCWTLPAYASKQGLPKDHPSTFDFEKHTISTFDDLPRETFQFYAQRIVCDNADDTIIVAQVYVSVDNPFALEPKFDSLLNDTTLLNSLELQSVLFSDPPLQPSYTPRELKAWMFLMSSLADEHYLQWVCPCMETGGLTLFDMLLPCDMQVQVPYGTIGVTIQRITVIKADSTEIRPDY